MLDPRGLHYENHLAPVIAENNLGIRLGAAKSRSRALLFGSGGLRELSKMSPRVLQELSKSSRGSKMRPGPLQGSILIRPETLGASKISIWGTTWNDFWRGPKGMLAQTRL